MNLVKIYVSYFETNTNTSHFRYPSFETIDVFEYQCLALLNIGGK